MKNIAISTITMIALALLAPAAEPEAKPDAKPAAEAARRSNFFSVNSSIQLEWEPGMGKSF